MYCDGPESTAPDALCREWCSHAACISQISDWVESNQAWYWSENTQQYERYFPNKDVPSQNLPEKTNG